MNKELALELAQVIGAGKPKYATGWVRALCPFARWYHSKGTDSNPSFGISVHEDDASRCHCFSCGVKADLFTMVLELHRLQEEDGLNDINIKRALEIVYEEESGNNTLPDLPSYEDLKGVSKSNLNSFPESWLQSFKKDYHNPYLLKRGVTQGTMEELDIRFDSSEQRVCIPIRARNGTLAGLQGRDVTGTNPLRYKLYDWQKKFNPSVWLMEHAVDLTDPVVMCEGFIDLAKIHAAYPNVVGAMTTAITKEKAHRLQDATMIFTFFDHGTGGDKGRAIVDKLWTDAFVTHLLPPEGYDDAGEMPSDLIGEILDQVL